MATARAGPDSNQTAPVGSGDYVIRAGDCIASIAFEHGLFWETVWNDPGNTELRTSRKTPYVLLPGDRVTIPELRERQESRPTDQLHRFVRKGVPVIVKIKILESPPPPDPPESPPADEEESQPGQELLVSEAEETESELQPARNKPYQVIVDGVLRESGDTGDEGMITVTVKPNAREVRLLIEPGTPRERAIPVRLGNLDPVDSSGGQAQRLANLGFQVDPNGRDADALAAALAEFQNAEGLDPTGVADASTLDKLKDVHGS